MDLIQRSLVTGKASYIKFLSRGGSKNRVCNVSLTVDLVARTTSKASVVNSIIARSLHDWARSRDRRKGGEGRERKGRLPAVPRVAITAAKKRTGGGVRGWCRLAKYMRTWGEGGWLLSFFAREVFCVCLVCTPFALDSKTRTPSGGDTSPFRGTLKFQTTPCCLSV